MAARPLATSSHSEYFASFTTTDVTSAENLEFIARGSNTNHLIADYLGLYYLGLLIPEFDMSEEWLSTGRHGLETEIVAQILADGADYECSLPYHRLVLEMFLSAYQLGIRNKKPFSKEYENRLRAMIQFSASFIGPSGTSPIIGDNDDGYIVKLASEDPSDHRPLVDIGGVLFGLPVPKNVDITEERFWYLGVERIEVRNQHKESVSVWHKPSGYVILRDSRTQITLNAAGIPPRQFGGHKHNDLLGLTLHCGEQPVLIDAGTACYTKDYEARNRSRSTATHNTVTIDSLEQQKYFHDRLFFMQASIRPVVDLFSTAGPVKVISAYHDGYRKSAGIIHRRTVWISLEEQMLAVRDEFIGESDRPHRYDVRFLTPLAARVVEPDRAALLSGDHSVGFRLIFGSTSPGTLEVSPFPWHPRYDNPQTGAQVCYAFSAGAPCFADTLILSGTSEPVGSTLFHFLDQIGFRAKTTDSSVLV